MNHHLLASLLFAGAKASEHAVLVAGSTGFMNYRHQADLCRAYHLLINNGFEEGNIIVMMSNDIHDWNETETQNAFPGQFFSETSPNAVDWYEGCKVDYSGDQVTPSNYLSILTGDDTDEALGGGPVLTSGEEDKVFLLFVDHGGVGSLCFPDGQLLHQPDLIAALATMTEKKMYDEMVSRLRECEPTIFPQLTQPRFSSWKLARLEACSRTQTARLCFRLTRRFT